MQCCSFVGYIIPADSRAAFDASRRTVNIRSASPVSATRARPARCAEAGAPQRALCNQEQNWRMTLDVKAFRRACVRCSLSALLNPWLTPLGARGGSVVSTQGSFGKNAVPSVDDVGCRANRVIGLRLMKLMRGHRSARREARLMVAEKLDAAFKANACMLEGASSDEIIRMYRRRVAMPSGSPNSTPAGRPSGAADASSLRD